MALGAIALITIESAEAGQTLLKTGATMFGAVYASYAAANVAQKGVVGANYRPELDKE